MSSQVGVFEQCNCITERFPGFQGNLLQAQVFEVYVIRKDVDLEYFDANKRRLLFRHHHNKRSHKVVAEQLVSDILQFGMYKGVRGVAWVIPEDKDTYLLMSAATTTECVYEAYQREPINPYVQQSINVGLRHAVELHPKTPLDVLIYLKGLHNDIKPGRGTSHVELYLDLPAELKSWAVYKKKQRLTARSCSKTGDNTYNKMFFSFVNDNRGDAKKVKNELHFRKMCSFFHKMSELGMFDAYSDVVDEHCNFMDSRCSLNNVCMYVCM